MNNTSIYLHYFNLFRMFGPKRLLRIGQYFENFEAAFKAKTADYIAAGIEPKLAEAFTRFKNTLDIDKAAQELEQENIQICTYNDKQYPALLTEIPSLPPILYYKGILLSDELALAVVGTRKISSYGQAVIPHILTEIATSGITVVSGLAYGVDAAAHKLALYNGARTIAVLGSGLDEKTLYPQDHVLLAEEIVANGGAIVSEYPPRVPALKQHFVARNRIISGLSVGTLVIECDIKSGALITAHHALDQNRSVYAVPGPIYSSTSIGPNNLIKMGARLVTEAADILTDLNISPATVSASEAVAETKEEAVLLALLSKEPLHSNQLIQTSGLPAAIVTTTLTFLEMKGRIRNIGGQQYIRAR